ncbi:hypothetical protein ACIP9H_42205 [Streptomyces sp. NPDC088732]
MSSEIRPVSVTPSESGIGITAVISGWADEIWPWPEAPRAAASEFSQ